MNRFSVFKCSSREASGCRCDPPICVPVVDVVVSPSLKENHVMTVDRHFDCLVCGPFMHRLRVCKNIAVDVRRGTVLVHPIVPTQQGG